MIESPLKKRFRNFFSRLGLGESFFYWAGFLANHRKWSEELDLWRDYNQFKKQVDSFIRQQNGVTSGKRALFVSLTEEVYQFKVELLLAKALQMQGVEPYFVLLKTQRRSRRYLKLFGFEQILDLETFRDEQKSAQRVASISEEDIHPPFTFDKLLDFKIGNVHVGQHVLSTYLASYQNSHKLLESSEFEDYVKLHTRRAVDSIPSIENILDSVRPDMVLFLEKGYIPSALFFDLALERQLSVIQWCGAQETDAYVLKKFTAANRKTHPFSLSPDSWETVKAAPWTLEQDEAFRRMLDDRYENDTWYNRNKLRAKVRIRTPTEVRDMLSLDLNKKTAMIFSHILWDATFFYGDNLFEDYEKWLVETVKAACQNDRLNWIVKLHPDYAWKLKRSGGKLHEPDILLETLGKLPSHVKLMLPETDISTYSLFDVTDYCLTVRGTIGIEMACFGVPVITAGTGRYSGLGFTLDSTTRADYVEKLKMLQDIPRLTEDQKILARKFANGLFKLRPFKLSTLKSYFHDVSEVKHPLFLNYSVQLRSYKDLENASDLQAFAEWVLDRSKTDYMQALNS